MLKIEKKKGIKERKQNRRECSLGLSHSIKSTEITESKQWFRKLALALDQIQAEEKLIAVTYDQRVSALRLSFL